MPSRAQLQVLADEIYKKDYNGNVYINDGIIFNLGVTIPFKLWTNFEVWTNSSGSYIFTNEAASSVSTSRLRLDGEILTMCVGN